MRKLFLLCTGLCLLGTSLPAQDDAGLQAGIDCFRAGRRVWDAEAMEEARTVLAGVVRRRPGEYEPLYWQSVSTFYLLLCYGLEDSAGYDPQKAGKLLDPAEKIMKAAIAARPGEAECHALLSSVYGFRIMRHPLSAIWNGPKVLSLQRTALQNDADNPHVLYIIGAGYFRAPSVFRNVDKARNLLEQAAEIYAKTPQSDRPGEPRWGRAECYGLLGDLYREQGDRTAAREKYRKALEINDRYTPAVNGMKELENGTQN